MGAFESYLIDEEKSVNTIKSYTLNVNSFMKWFDESKGTSFMMLHSENIKEYISYLKVIKKLNPRSINAQISSLIKFNEFLISNGTQTEQVITKRNMIKIQRQYTSLSTVDLADVEKFRQLVLESNSKRNYAIVSLLAYCGLRISEALNVKMDNFNIISQQLVVTEGKGKKTRTVILNNKAITALQGWIKERNSSGVTSDYLFPSNRGNKLDRTVINKLFNSYSKIVGKEITPHDLRHFFCTHALENDFSVHEVAHMAGHSNIQTTLLYTNPNMQNMIDKMNKL